MGKKAFIYKIQNVETGKLYIGSSSRPQKRWYEHKRDLKRNQHHSAYLQNSWNKYGEECFIFEVIDETTVENQFKVEREWIIKEQTTDSEYGYNMAEPCETGGHYKTEAHKQHLSEIMKVKRNEYFDKVKASGKLEVRIYNLLTDTYETFKSKSSKDCPYKLAACGTKNFSIPICCISTYNKSEQQIQQEYDRFKSRYVNYLKSQQSIPKVKKTEQSDYKRKSTSTYKSVWICKSTGIKLTFDNNKQAAFHFNVSRKMISTAVRQGFYKQFSIQV